MTRFFSFALACVLSVAASTAQATVLSSYLTFDGPAHYTDPPFQGGGEDFLQDDSVSALVNRAGAAGTFDPGDVVWGVLTLSDIQASGLPSVPVSVPNQIAIVFSAQIVGAAPDGSIALAPIGNAADPLDLRNLIGDPLLRTGLNDNSIATILSSSTAATPAGDPLNWTTAQVSNPVTGFGTANGWGYELTADLVPGTDDFFHFLGTVTGGIDIAALTITSQAFGAQWIPVDVADFAGGIHFGDITLDQGFVSRASAVQQSRGWFFRDDSSLFVNPVPEPGSMAVFGLLGAAAFARARRRNKK